MKEPERILKKTKGPNNLWRYQVKWKGFDEPTWESEETLAKHRELIEDYNFFALTGDRYDERKLQELRDQSNAQQQQQQQQQQPSPQPPPQPKIKTAIKRVSAPKPYPSPQLSQNHDSESLSKKEKKTDKCDSKALEKLDAKISTNFAQETERALAVENNVAIVAQHQSNVKMAHILSQKQYEITKSLASIYATQEDKIDKIKLQLTDDACVFQILWKARADGTIPYPGFYQYDQFKLVAPLLYIQFVECCLLECEATDADITFEGPGKDLQERIELIRAVLSGRVRAQ